LANYAPEEIRKKYNCDTMVYTL